MTPFRGRGRGGQEPAFAVSAEINVTPMTDVMLVLLIIFMVVGPAIPAVALPRARMAAPERDERVTLVIDRSGAFAVESGGRAVEPGGRALADVLRSAYAERPDDHVLYLKADAGVGYGRVLEAVDAAREAGVRRIGAITAAAPRPRVSAAGGTMRAPER